MADWPLLADIQRVEVAGSDAAVSAGTVVTSGAANTKGAWAQLIASTSFESAWLLVRIDDLVASSRDYLIDIGIGPAASEQVIVANIPAAIRSTVYTGELFIVPLAIPAGTRVSARVQQSATAAACKVTAHLFGGGFGQSSPPSVCDTYGAATVDSGGVSIDPGGTAHTKGAWTEITPATARDLRWLVLSLGNQANGARTLCTWLVDIGVGAGGSEQVIVPDIYVVTLTTGALFPVLIPLPMSVAAGARLAVRAQCSIIDAVDRTFDAIIHGAG